MDDERGTPGDRISRRAALAGIGGVVATALTAGRWKPAAASPSLTRLAGTHLTTPVACILTPEQVEGPFYVPDELVRRDIREGEPGTSLVLALGVVDAATCVPIPDAAVDVWQCNALGIYSRFGQGQGENFLRGIQYTNANGIAFFHTIYPGWYMGRTVHVHVKVHVGEDVVHTGQLYFRDPLTDVVYLDPPYNKRPDRDTRNADDPFFQNGGPESMLKVRSQGSGYRGGIRMGVLTPERRPAGLPRVEAAGVPSRSRRDR